jgi:hypothetical protein
MSGYTPGSVEGDDGLDVQRLRKPFTTPDLTDALTRAFEREPLPDSTAPVSP